MVWPVFAALGTALKAAAPQLIQGVAAKALGGGKSNTTTSRVNYQQLRNDAQAAGFNPLTALMATGGAGNTTTTGPQLSSFQFMADALGTGAETWFNREQIARDEEVERIKVETMREELVALQRRNANPDSRRDFGYSIPHVVTASREERGAPALSGNPLIPTTERDIANTVVPWSVDSRWTPAETVEQEYAEVGSFPYSAAKIIHDGGWNVGVRIGANRMKKSIRNAYLRKKYGVKPGQPVPRDTYKDFMRDQYPTAYD